MKTDKAANKTTQDNVTDGRNGITVTNQRNVFGTVTVIIRDAIDAKPLLVAKPSVLLAAPEMLAALKAILAWDKINTSIAINTEGVDAFQKMVAAIRKAEGK